jgi:hypothetical protein
MSESQGDCPDFQLTVRLSPKSRPDERFSWLHGLAMHVLFSWSTRLIVASERGGK